MKKYLFLLLTICLGFSCNKFDETAQFEEDIATIETYLADNNIVAQKTDEGVYYTITEEGSGDDHPDVSNTVQCSYVGFLMDDFSVFDASSNNQPAEFALSQVIEGWQIGIPKLKRNGSGRFYIPSRLAYGNTKRTSIPKNSILIFDVYLVHFW